MIYAAFWPCIHEFDVLQMRHIANGWIDRWFVAWGSSENIIKKGFDKV